MSDITFSAAPRARAIGAHGAVLWADVAVGIAVVLVFALARPFEGIEHDARLYIGRALADLDPAGVGRDLMFRLDGQSSFTIYRPIVSKAVALLGLGRAVLALTLLNMVVWLAAIATFARVILPGRALVLGLAAAGVLSTVYAPWHLIAAGEAFPVPRPLAEAAVLLALAALCRGRVVTAVLLLIVGAAFHPIMAAPGFGVLLVMQALRDRRWLGACLLAGAAIALAATLGLPLAGRLAARVDPAWRAVLVERNPYLFVGLWPWASTGSATVVRAVTIVVACRWVGARERVVLLAALGIGLAGVLASFVLGDLAGSVLMLQAQLWRAIWLPAALAPLAAGVCLWRLPAQGPAGQITLALLVAAWSSFDWPEMAPLAASLVLVVHYGAARLSIRLDRLALATWVLAAAIAAMATWTSLAGIIELARSLPPGATLPTALIAKLHVAVLPVMALVAAWWHWRDRAVVLPASLAVVAILALLLVTQWDRRDAARAETDGGARRSDLAQILAARPGPLLWLEGDDAWYWLGRPLWSGQIQGSSIVFSRDLALEWQRRAEAVVRAGLVTPYLLRPLETAQPVEAPKLDAAKIEAFCARFEVRDREGPAWIVLPIDPDTFVPARLDATIWTAPIPQFKLVVKDGTPHWRRMDRYALIPCASGLPR